MSWKMGLNILANVKMRCEVSYGDSCEPHPLQCSNCALSVSIFNHGSPVILIDLLSVSACWIMSAIVTSVLQSCEFKKEKDKIVII